MTATAESPGLGAATTAIGAVGVTMRFGGVVALNDVDLRVPPGEICGVIGPNGAGKTTLFDVLSGVRRPTQGSVVLGDRDVTRRSVTWRARHGLRRTFQRQQVFGHLSVEDNLLVAVEWRRRGSAVVDLLPARSRRGAEVPARAHAREVIARCGLEDVRDVAAGHLPIGLARLLELARALMDEPDVLLLDEPTSGLSSYESEAFAAAMHAYRDESGCSILLVEHDVAFIMGQCDRVVVLHLGEILADGSPDVVQNDAAVASAYLG